MIKQIIKRMKVEQCFERCLGKNSKPAATLLTVIRIELERAAMRIRAVDTAVRRGVCG